MAEQKNEVVATFSDFLSEKLVSVESALPSDFNKTRFVQNAMAVLNDNPNLTKVNKAQLVQGLLKGAYLGLDFMNKECYLIAYGGTVNFQTDYKGEIKFVKRYAIRPIKDIYAKIVRAGDYFEEKIIDGKASIDFKPKPFNDDEVVGAFAVVLYEDGGMEYETMTTKQINEVRNNYSKQANGNTWKKSWDEMAKKTVLRRLCKHIETDFESVEARKAWDDGSDTEFTVKANKSDEPIVDVFASNQPKEVFVESEVVDSGE